MLFLYWDTPARFACQTCLPPKTYFDLHTIRKLVGAEPSEDYRRNTKKQKKTDSV